MWTGSSDISRKVRNETLTNHSLYGERGDGLSWTGPVPFSMRFCSNSKFQQQSLASVSHMMHFPPTIPDEDLLGKGESQRQDVCLQVQAFIGKRSLHTISLWQAE